MTKSYEDQLHEVASSVAANYPVDDDQYIKAINDAASNTYQDGISNEDWRLEILKRLGYVTA